MAQNNDTEIELLPPNLNSQGYRSFKSDNSGVRLHQFLDCISSSSDGKFALTSSDLNGRFWDGSLFIYDKEESLLQLNNSPICYKTSSGITDCKFLQADQLITSEDLGHLTIWSLSDDQIAPIYYCEAHDETINEISLWPQKDHLVTCDRGKSIKVWQVRDDAVSIVHQFRDAHLNMVSSAAASPADTSVFSSCSWDKLALLWDTRMESPATLLYENEFCALTRVAWHPIDANYVAVSTTKGDLYVLDKRSPMEFVSKICCASRPIFRLCFNAEGMLAICANDNIIRIVDIKAYDCPDIIYQNSQHKDFVRGMLWTTNSTLLACGWDKTVSKHTI